MKKLFVLLLFTVAFKYHSTTEPKISVYQGSTPGTSVIEIIWPDGKVERLVYKDKQVKDGADGYLHWFDERYKEFENRSR